MEAYGLRGLLAEYGEVCRPLKLTVERLFCSVTNSCCRSI